MTASLHQMGCENCQMTNPIRHTQPVSSGIHIAVRVTPEQGGIAGTLLTSRTTQHVNLGLYPSMVP